MVIAFAGRFNADFLVAAAKELVQATGEPGFASWGMAFCYGNRLETRRSGKSGAEGFSFSELSDVKTDMALLVLNESPEAVMPLVRREKGKDWSWCTQPSLPSGGEPAAIAADYARRLLLELDPEDPVGTTEKVRQTGPGQSCFFSSVELLFADLRSPAVTGQEPGAWLGTGQLVSLLSPVPLRQLPNIEWEAVPAQTALVFTRFRHELP